MVGRVDEGIREPDRPAPRQRLRPWLAIGIGGSGGVAVRSTATGCDVSITDAEERSAAGARGDRRLMSIRPIGCHRADAGLLGRALDLAVDRRVGGWRLRGGHAPQNRSLLFTAKDDDRGLSVAEAIEVPARRWGREEQMAVMDAMDGPREQA